MSEPARDYHVGQCVRYKPHHPGDVWAEELWWIVAKVTTEHWGRPPTVFYHVAKVADPAAVWRLDGCVHAGMLAPAEAPPGFHLPPHSA